MLPVHRTVFTEAIFSSVSSSSFFAMRFIASGVILCPWQPQTAKSRHSPHLCILAFSYVTTF